MAKKFYAVEITPKYPKGKTTYVWANSAKEAVDLVDGSCDMRDMVGTYDVNIKPRIATDAEVKRKGNQYDND